MGWLLDCRGQRPNFGEKRASKGGKWVYQGWGRGLLACLTSATRPSSQPSREEVQLGQELERMQEQSQGGGGHEIDGTSCLDLDNSESRVLGKQILL